MKDKAEQWSADSEIKAIWLNSPKRTNQYQQSVSIQRTARNAFSVTASTSGALASKNFPTSGWISNNWQSWCSSKLTAADSLCLRQWLCLWIQISRYDEQTTRHPLSPRQQLPKPSSSLPPPIPTLLSSNWAFSGAATRLAATEPLRGG
ncbi:MAG: hypothetical protein WKF84_00295 [Pyrinomonadaceae bacterium]